MVEIPEFFYETSSSKRFEKEIGLYLRQRRSFFILVGDKGSGKSTLLKRLRDRLKDEYLTLYFEGGFNSPKEAFRSILDSLGVHVKSDGYFTEQIFSELIRLLLSKKKEVVILLDDAETLKESVISFFLMLSNLESPVLKMFHLVLAGESRLLKRLSEKKALRRFKPAFIHFLSPITLEEFGFYLNQMLNMMQRIDLKIRRFDLPLLYSFTSGNFSLTREAIKKVLMSLSESKRDILERRSFYVLAKNHARFESRLSNLILILLFILILLLLPHDLERVAHERIIGAIKFLKECLP